MDTREIVELLAGAMLPIGYIGFMWHRIALKKPISVRAIQYTTVVMLIPAILVLALEKVLDSATIGTLIGGLTGYLLSGISNYDKPSGNADA